MIALFTDAILKLGPHLALNLLTVGVIVQAIYVRLSPRREHAFTYWLLNLITFSVAYVLAGVRVEIGLSLGLFAVFGILRYRTEAMRIRDLTYLFVVIGLAMLNGVAQSPEGMARAALIDLTVIIAIAVLELNRGSEHEDTVVVRYDRLDLLPASRRGELLADLSRRLGAPCLRAAVESVDLMHDSAQLTVTFRVSAAETTPARDESLQTETSR